MNATLSVQAKLINGNKLSVDLLVINRVDKIVFCREAIDDKTINRGTITSSDIAKITSERNIYDVNLVLKDRELAIDGDIMDDVVNIVMKIIDIYDSYELKHVLIREPVKLKSIKE